MALQIKHVTFSGVDETVSVKDLVALARMWNGLLTVEYAVLHRHGGSKPRYPHNNWVDKFLTHTERFNVQRALHLCGAAVDAALNGEYPNRMDRWNRVQLNICKYDTLPESFDPAKYQLGMDNLMTHAVLPIIQVSSQNPEVVDAVISNTPFPSILMDASGGRGESPRVWTRGRSEFAVGYAGGLGPDNITEELGRIQSVVGELNMVWVDMESGIRTNDRIDLRKMQSVLTQVHKWNGRGVS